MARMQTSLKEGPGGWIIPHITAPYFKVNTYKIQLNAEVPHSKVALDVRALNLTEKT